MRYRFDLANTMLLKIPAVPLDSKEPWKGDLFERDRLASDLCTLLKTAGHSTVIGIDAPYGFGKTFFLTRLCEQIKVEGGWTIYINAWEQDYVESPILALLDAIKTATIELIGDKKAKASLKAVAKAAAPILVKIATKRLTDTLLGRGASEEISEAAGEVSGTAAGVFLERFMNESAGHVALKKLREEIGSFVSSQIKTDAAYPNLTIVVDELDRARPNYSIQLLESIKHLFSLAQVTFIIGCDRQVLAQSAKHEFGAGLPVDGYFRRLFDYWIELPAPVSAKYVTYCAEKLNLVKDQITTADGDIDNSIESYRSFFLMGCNTSSISLRLIEQSVCHMNICVRSVPAGHFKYVGLIGWLQGLRFHNAGAYDRYLNSATIYESHEIIIGMRSVIKARDWLKAWIIAWAASNVAEIRLDEVKRRFDGELGGILSSILSDRPFRYSRETSIAAQTDSRLRVIASRFQS